MLMVKIASLHWDVISVDLWGTLWIWQWSMKGKMAILVMNKQVRSLKTTTPESREKNCFGLEKKVKVSWGILS